MVKGRLNLASTDRAWHCPEAVTLGADKDTAAWGLRVATASATTGKGSRQLLLHTEGAGGL